MKVVALQICASVESLTMSGLHVGITKSAVEAVAQRSIHGHIPVLSELELRMRGDRKDEHSDRYEDHSRRGSFCTGVAGHGLSPDYRTSILALLRSFWPREDRISCCFCLCRSDINLFFSSANGVLPAGV